MATILNSAILDSAILHRINFTHSFWLNLMMAAIFNSAMLDSATAILDSDTLLSSLRFTQKHSQSNLTLNQTNSIWLKLIPSHVTWWWQPSWILPSCIQLFCTKKTSLIYSDSTWWSLSWILPCWIQPFCTKLWLKLIQFNSNSFILIQLDDGSQSWILPSWIHPFCTKILPLFILNQPDDGSHLEFCQPEFHHIGFSHLSISSQTHSHLPTLIPTICIKKTSLIHSD